MPVHCVSPVMFRVPLELFDDDSTLLFEKEVTDMLH